MPVAPVSGSQAMLDQFKPAGRYEKCIVHHILYIVLYIWNNVYDWLSNCNHLHIFLYFCIVWLVIQDSNSFQHGNPDLRVTHQSHRPTVTGSCGNFCLQWPGRFVTHWFVDKSSLPKTMLLRSSVFDRVSVNDGHVFLNSWLNCWGGTLFWTLSALAQSCSRYQRCRRWRGPVPMLASPWFLS